MDGTAGHIFRYAHLPSPNVLSYDLSVQCHMEPVRTNYTDELKEGYIDLWGYIYIYEMLN